MRATYRTATENPTVYYTALAVDGSILTERTTTGVTLVMGFYTYEQPVIGVHEFIAVWDEGDPADQHALIAAAVTEVLADNELRRLVTNELKKHDPGLLRGKK